MHRHIFSHPGVNLSPLGAIPKENKPRKWCLIMDLSSPAESSVNDSMYIAWVVICLLCLYWSLIIPSSRSRQRLSLSRQTSRRPTGCCQFTRMTKTYWEFNGRMSATLMELSHLGLCSALEFFSAVADALQWFLEKRHQKFAPLPRWLHICFQVRGSRCCL